MPHEPEPLKRSAPALFSGGTLAAPQQPAGRLPASAAPETLGPQRTPTPQHAPGQQNMAETHQMPGSQRMAIPLHMQIAHAHAKSQSPAGDEHDAAWHILHAWCPRPSSDVAGDPSLCPLHLQTSS